MVHITNMQECFLFILLASVEAGGKRPPPCTGQSEAERLDSWFSALTVGSFLIIVPISLANLISASAIVDVMVCIIV